MADYDWFSDRHEIAASRKAELAKDGWAEKNAYSIHTTTVIYCLYCGCVVELKEVHRTKCKKED